MNESVLSVRWKAFCGALRSPDFGPARPAYLTVLSGPARHKLRPIVPCSSRRLGTRPGEAWSRWHGVPPLRAMSVPYRAGTARWPSILPPGRSRFRRPSVGSATSHPRAVAADADPIQPRFERRPRRAHYSELRRAALRPVELTWEFFFLKVWLGSWGCGQYSVGLPSVISHYSHGSLLNGWRQGSAPGSRKVQILPIAWWMNFATD